MTKIFPKPSDDGIDPAFENEIESSMVELDKTAPQPSGLNSGAAFFQRDRPSLRAITSSGTPIDQAHRTLSRTEDLCTRVEALCGALVGGGSQGGIDKGDRAEGKGLMGKLSHHAVDVGDRITQLNKRLNELEQTLLGHVSVETSAG